jgi:hypothetical protein
MKYTQPTVERLILVGQMITTQSECAARGGVWTDLGCMARSQ